MVAGSSVAILLCVLTHGELVEWVDSGVEVRLRQVQIHGGVFQPFMPHQQLDGAQVRAGLEQMGGEAVPERVRTHPLLDTGACGRGLADVPHGLVRDRSLDCAYFAREQIDAWLLPAPV